jgi:hypothetical protein
VEKVAENFGLLLQLKKRPKAGKQPPNRRNFAPSGHPDGNYRPEEVSAIADF